MTTLTKRLQKMELASEEAASAWRRAQRDQNNEAANAVWMEVAADPAGARAFRTVSGQNMDRRGATEGRIPDELDIERALVQLGEMFQAKAKLIGLVPSAPVDEDDGEIDDDWQRLDGSPEFKRNTQRFARASRSNRAVAQRYSNACLRRCRGKECEGEYHVARAVFLPRLDAFLAGEARPRRRRGVPA